MGTIKIIHQDCDPSLSEDKSLPYTAYMVEYVQGETSHYDIVMSNKRVDIFDHYWDKYRHDFVTMNQTEGRTNPKLYGYKSSDKKKKK
jgi:hypothetical protein|tara:strand:- start:1314 stop:1577 length:264 start_codon:yes stop_codon:yes gene_type:complete